MRDRLDSLPVVERKGVVGFRVVNPGRPVPALDDGACDTEPGMVVSDVNVLFPALRRMLVFSD